MGVYFKESYLCLTNGGLFVHQSVAGSTCSSCVCVSVADLRLSSLFRLGDKIIGRCIKCNNLHDRYSDARCRKCNMLVLYCQDCESLSGGENLSNAFDIICRTCVSKCVV